jgi:hypothetical protein
MQRINKEIAKIIMIKILSNPISVVIISTNLPKESSSLFTNDKVGFVIFYSGSFIYYSSYVCNTIDG